jgi:hypothetical protein
VRSLKWGLTPFLLCAAVALAQELPHYTLVEPGSPASARDTAQLLLKHLADGNIDGAATLSNEPVRRREVLRDYKASVGDAEFKRIFSRYLDPANPLVAEVAVGPRRLLIWRLGEAADHLAAQYYVETDGKFLMDDRPSEERAQLRQILEGYRSGKLRFSG